MLATAAPAYGTVPTIGMEEEFLLVDKETGAPVPINAAVADAASKRQIDLQLELTSCQVETATAPVDTATQLLDELRRLRRTVNECAAEHSALLLAVGVPPATPNGFPITDTARYRMIGEKFGMIAHEQGICGAHVHVSVPDQDVAVQACNWMRPWLPLLLALTANSPIYRRAETGYLSWRSVLWRRWPSAGPPPYLEDVAAYDKAVELLLAAGAILDEGMVYWDVRPSKKFPTVEVRVSDIPATATESVLLAVLVRAIVMMSVEEDRAGHRAPRVDPEELRAAYWKAARDGLGGEFLDVLSHEIVSGRAHLDRLITYVRPALEAAKDWDRARALLDDVCAQGNGAARQLAVFRRNRDAREVIAEAARATVQP
ncbi:glutamate--cysteine ligase [Skermania sp. ID1734]|uniref:carboxylate-amine ligase n=1 Tax=Skermania sp. ID1734 TaxID=2597516 RepID=UPI002107FC59|nr:glutamate--cysteine ligase [Skermania sp. ID1734]